METDSTHPIICCQCQKTLGTYEEMKAQNTDKNFLSLICNCGLGMTVTFPPTPASPPTSGGK